MGIYRLGYAQEVTRPSGEWANWHGDWKAHLKKPGDWIMKAQKRS